MYVPCILMGTGSFPGVKRSARDADPSLPSSAVVKKEYSYTCTPPMGRKACTEPQCLYKGTIYLTFLPCILYGLLSRLTNAHYMYIYMYIYIYIYIHIYTIFRIS